MPLIALFLAVLLLGAPDAGAESWRRPVDGPLLRAFRLGTNPYARGQHRGADLAARVRSSVRSACTGRVRFAGRVPRGGRTVSVRCGELVATYQQLGAIAVREGQLVMAGALIGAVGRSEDPRAPSPHIHLGARVAATGRYLDPLSLLHAARPELPLLGPVRSRSPRVGRPGPPPSAPRMLPLGRSPAPAAPLASSRDRAGLPAPRPWSAEPAPAPNVPWIVWLGLAGVGVALPIGGALSVRRRRERAIRRPAVSLR